MKDLIVLLTKDCMPKEALPCYGGLEYWKGKTPNIDALAEKGTMFTRYYAAAASTYMSMSTMLTGRYPYEFTSRRRYIQVLYGEFPSIYDTLQEMGYECHVIMGDLWLSSLKPLVGEFGNWDKVAFHNVGHISQDTDFHPETTYLSRDDALLKKTVESVCAAFDAIDLSKKQFVWCHLPHILNGRTAYMSDMDAFDDVVGYARKRFGDDNIYLSADHGHMNMHKHIAGYGFDVYEPVINIPLITPRINGLRKCDSLLGNVDLLEILLHHRIPKERNYVYSDTKYYAQPGRKVAVVSKRYKYIYNAGDKSEELYDLAWDPEENYNILERYYFDKNRNRILFYDEHYFYPYKEETMAALPELKEAWSKMWREPNWKEKARRSVREMLEKCPLIFNALISVKEKLSSKISIFKAR